MMNCNDTYIKRVIGVTRTFSWTITTNGEAQSLEGRDLTLVLIHPRGQWEELDFTTAGNVVSFTWQGKDQKELGRYGLILYENYGKSNQLRVDIHKFLELIPWSDRQSGTYADLTETNTNLGSEEISGETVVVDNLNSTNPSFALSANMGRVLNETKMPANATLADIPGDSTHRTVTDAQMTSWSSKQSPLTGYKVMSIDEGHILFDNGNITGVYKGWGDDPQHVLHWPNTNDYLTTTKGIENYLDYYNYYRKPQSGIPASDMASAVQTSLDKADAAAPQATTYTKSEVDALVGSGVTVDDALSTTSENPVQNKVVTNALNGKQATIDDLSTIRSGAAAGATAYQKPGAGIPESDMASAVQTSLGKADSAYQKPGSGIPKTDLASAVQTSLGKADSAYQKPDTGIPSSDMASAVQNSLGKADSAYQKPGTGIPKTDLASAVQTSLEKADTALQSFTETDPVFSASPAAGITAANISAWNAKQNALTFDDAPTANSNNPVKSGGIKTALDAKQATISTVNVTVDNNTGTPSGSASVSGSTLSISFQNLKGATGAQGPQGIQGVQGIQGPKGDTGVSGDASSLAIIHGIDKTTSYTTTDVCGADAAQTLLNEIEGGFYY